MIEVHEAMRLLLIVEQTPEVLLRIAGRQPIVKELVAGAWIQLVSLDPTTGAMARFVPDKGFFPWTTSGAPVPTAPDSRTWYGQMIDFRPPALIGGAHV
jgi:hypothetical protein